MQKNEASSSCCTSTSVSLQITHPRKRPSRSFTDIPYVTAYFSIIRVSPEGSSWGAWLVCLGPLSFTIMAFQHSALPVRTFNQEGWSGLLMAILGYRGCDLWNMAFNVECDCGTITGLRTEGTEHATFKSRKERGSANTTAFPISCRCYKGMRYCHMFRD